jgi:RNA polymerase sigma factor (sigma-70 family)
MMDGERAPERAMSSPLSATVARVGRSLMTDLTDGQLVGRFVRSRDGDAFAALVRRHGPMVLAVCRRVAGDPHLADDAFQAAFLVLARRAADVTPREAVRAWLYGVAVRTAREARSMSARCRSREVPVAAVPDRAAFADRSADGDALRALDEEIARLPDHLRAAVVLCELDGLSRKDAAARLGIPEGTLSSRLAKARKVLAERLRGRGVTMPAVGLAALTGRSQGAVPVELTDAAARLAVDPGPVPASVAELARRGLGAMLLTRLKRAAAGASAWLLLVGLAVAFANPDPPPDSPAPLPDPPKATGRLLTVRGQRLVLIDPDGKNETPVTAKVEGMFAFHMARLSPDGKHVAFIRWENGKERLRAYLTEVGGKEAALDLPRSPVAIAWTPGGQLTVSMGTRDPKDDGWAPYWSVDPKTGRATELKLGSWQPVREWFPDGRSFVGMDAPLKKGEKGIWLARVGLDGKAGRLTDPGPGGHDHIGRLSPDGKTLLFQRTVDHKLPEIVEPVAEWVGYVRPLRHTDLFTATVGNPESAGPVIHQPPPAEGAYGAHCWSPDGKRIAYLFWAGRAKEKEVRLVIATPDGANAKVVVTEKAEEFSADCLDWR